MSCDRACSACDSIFSDNKWFELWDGLKARARELGYREAYPDMEQHFKGVFGLMLHEWAGELEEKVILAHSDSDVDYLVLSAYDDPDYLYVSEEDSSEYLDSADSTDSLGWE